MGQVRRSENALEPSPVDRPPLVSRGDCPGHNRDLTAFRPRLDPFCLEPDPAGGTLIAVAGSKNSATSIFPGFGKNWQLSMASIIHPLLALLASLTRQELARQVTYLQAENQILRSELPERITLSNQERRKLVRHGKKLGARIKDLISIVSYSTLRKWVRQMEDGAAAAKPAEGNPAAPALPETNPFAERFQFFSTRNPLACLDLAISSGVRWPAGESNLSRKGWLRLTQSC